MFNFSFSNTTIYTSPLSFNCSFSNTSRSAYLFFNCSFSNSSLAGITLSNPYPSDDSSRVAMDVILNITVTSYNGSEMNLSWYWGNSTGNLTNYLGSTLAIYNGTYHMHLANASTKNTGFYWSVNASDGYVWENETYNFTTGYIKGVLPITNTRTNNIMLYIMIFLLIFFILLGIIKIRSRFIGD